MGILKILMNGRDLVLKYMKKTRDAIGFGNNGNPTRYPKSLDEAGMIKGCRNDLSRYYGLLFLLLLVACQAAPTSTPSTTAPTLTSTATTRAATPIHTATATLLPPPTSQPSNTPEPAWYQKVDPALGALKYQYANVLNAKARVYASFKDAVAKTGNFGHLPNFPAYVAYTANKQGSDGQTYYLVNYGWMNGQDLQMLTPSTFSGILLTRQVTFRFGWVLADTQSVNMAGTPLQTYKRYQVVHEMPVAAQKTGYLAIGPDEWLPATAVTLVNPAVPAEAGPNTCRFIYTNLATQTLSVYDKCKLVYATLISSGKNSWTFEGRFAILYKVDYGSITPPATSTSDYYIEGVPYFMTYSGNFGFHAAYWHDSFGSAASHGCINLAPADAKWLYDWASLGERVIISAGK
jgi:lipoprotein-anchoring transpeptidase ErfK/SrfK